MDWGVSDNKKIADYSGGVVSLSNALNDAAMCLTLMEKRLIFFCIAEINSIKSRHQQTNDFKISVVDFAELYNLPVASTYQELRRITIGIMKKQWEYVELDNRGNDVIRRRQWLTACDYHKNEGWVRVKFSGEVAPYLTLLRTQFTSYRLEQASALRSLYSWRLLEKLMQFENDGKGWWAVEIEDFCRIMEATEKQKTDFAKIRTKIIEPAIKELTEKDGWSIEYTTIKAGRKVISLRFDFQRVPPKPLLTQDA